MRNIYFYLDETGTPNYSNTNNPIFGIGSAMFTDETHQPALSKISELRMKLGQNGTNLENGFHAKDDSIQTRDEMLSLIATTGVEIRATLFNKNNAFPRIKERGDLWLYKYAIFRHLDHIIARCTLPTDKITIIAAHIDLKAKREKLRFALEDVNDQLAVKRDTRLLVWKSSTSYGLQIADYGLWAIQRKELRGEVPVTIENSLDTIWKKIGDQYPWGRI